MSCSSSCGTPESALPCVNDSCDQVSPHGAEDVMVSTSKAPLMDGMDSLIHPQLLIERPARKATKGSNTSMTLSRCTTSSVGGHANHDTITLATTTASSPTWRGYQYMWHV
eukprot:Blabericola_migrator_1__11866@NODE_722_length_6730_cov_58_989494_g520_i0_p7_GENE_NODE_722_length_6730_cov_58_989494_g520_i0NODE_722_length_6730_cov_58_989494_g520_i0_p7_ORF_typecomplete_len111_score5_24_NODE_722_length_6730_cov_58_989494_g520_i052415573